MRSLKKCRRWQKEGTVNKVKGKEEKNELRVWGVRKVEVIEGEAGEKVVERKGKI